MGRYYRVGTYKYTRFYFFICVSFWDDNSVENEILMRLV
jgi:hypothetical protein